MNSRISLLAIGICVRRANAYIIVTFSLELFRIYVYDINALFLLRSRGTFSVIRKCRDTQTDGLCAVKIVDISRMKATTGLTHEGIWQFRSLSTTNWLQIWFPMYST